MLSDRPTRTGFLLTVVCCAGFIAVGVSQYRLSSRLDEVERLAHRNSTGLGGSRGRAVDGVLDVEPTPLSLDGASSKGNRSARVALVEYSDFSCPYCLSFAAKTLPDIERRYIATGQILFVFKHLPIDRLHPAARSQAELAECGQRQGRFWEVHDAIFKRPGSSQTAEILRELESNAAMNVATLRNCLTLNEGQAQVAADAEEARRFRISGTPAFLAGSLNGSIVQVTRRINGARPFETFRKVLDQLLSSN